MEDFLTALEELIEANCETLSAIELIGALQVTQQRLAFDLFTEADDAKE